MFTTDVDCGYAVQQRRSVIIATMMPGMIAISFDCLNIGHLRRPFCHFLINTQSSE